MFFKYFIYEYNIQESILNIHSCKIFMEFMVYILLQTDTDRDI